MCLDECTHTHKYTQTLQYYYAEDSVNSMSDSRLSVGCVRGSCLVLKGLRDLRDSRGPIENFTHYNFLKG